MMTDMMSLEHRSAIVRDFARSTLFDRTFKDGMSLVDETADYLDGGGRQESRMLSRTAAATYARQSMHLTTRLMQVASWLLVQKAVRDGGMTAIDACQTRYRLNQKPGEPLTVPANDLPPRLVGLLDRSDRLYARIAHLDGRMYLDQGSSEATNPVQAQFDRLHQAFEARP
jgi:regulator of CtrA degradation